MMALLVSLTGCGQPPASWQFLKEYPKEDVLYFRDIAFGRSDEITRWNGDIKIQIIGDRTFQDSIDLEQAIEELREFLTNRKISIVNRMGNAFINFPMNDEKFTSYLEPDKPIPRGFTNTILDPFGNLIMARVFINPSLKGLNRKQTLRHELCHAMGLSNHSLKVFKEPHLLGVTGYDFDDIVVDNPTPFTKFPEADRNAIRILYNPSLPEGTSKSEFNLALKKLGYW